MKKLLLISLCLGFFLQTVHATETYSDSIEKAFDNCVYKCDSLTNELVHLQELAQMDSAVNAKYNEKIELLHRQIDELNIQIANFIISEKKNEYNLKECEVGAEKALTKEKRKAKFNAWVSGGASFGGGVGVGGLAVGLYYLFR